MDNDHDNHHKISEKSQKNMEKPSNSTQEKYMDNFDFEEYINSEECDNGMGSPISADTPDQSFEKSSVVERSQMKHLHSVNGSDLFFQVLPNPSFGFFLAPEDYDFLQKEYQSMPFN